MEKNPLEAPLVRQADGELKKENIFLNTSQNVISIRGKKAKMGSSIVYLPFYLGQGFENIFDIVPLN